jgi:hypothetical protein
MSSHPTAGCGGSGVGAGGGNWGVATGGGTGSGAGLGAHDAAATITPIIANARIVFIGAALPGLVAAHKHKPPHASKRKADGRCICAAAPQPKPFTACSMLPGYATDQSSEKMIL